LLFPAVPSNVCWQITETSSTPSVLVNGGTTGKVVAVHLGQKRTERGTVKCLVGSDNVKRSLVVLNPAVKGDPYVGTGNSKAKAYEDAARKALHALKEKYPDTIPDEYL
jgi:hypothetical protein